EGQERRVGVDEVRREVAHEVWGQDPHEASTDHETRFGVNAVGLADTALTEIVLADIVRTNFCGERSAPLFSARVVTRPYDEGPHAGTSGVCEPRGIGVAAYCDDASRVCVVAGGLEQCFEIAAPARDQYDDLQHSPSLPGVTGVPDLVCE